MAVDSSPPPVLSDPGLKRTVGFWGLMFVSLGSIIGSGWLLGALNASKVAGPASLISWVLAAVMLIVLALIHADLGAAYPVAGGTTRYPHFAFGGLAGFTAGWTAYLQAVTLAPIEVEASISYLNSTGWAQDHLRMQHSDTTLNTTGLLVASAAILVFTIINLLGAKLLSDSNTVMVIWKAAVPIVTVGTLLILRFHPGNFTAGGGFFVMGAHGIFAALPAGVVFALQGFEQAAQLAGEAKNPQKDVSRAIIVAMLIGAVIYILLEIAFIGALLPSNLVGGWANPIGAAGDYGPYYTLAIGLGAGWLATVLIIDAVISPAGTGLVYVGTAARISYALGEDDAMPSQLTKVSKQGVPFWSILLAFVLGLIAFLPFPSWNSLVGLVTNAVAIMYAFAPPSLAALMQKDPDRVHPYRLPYPNVLLPAGFVFANFIIYWGGFEASWKIVTGIFIGRMIFEFALRRRENIERVDIDWRAASWIWPWLIGLTIIGLLGNYGTGSLGTLPNWIDLLVVIAFSLTIFYYAVSLSMSSEQVQATIAKQETLSARMDAELGAE